MHFLAFSILPDKMHKFYACEYSLIELLMMGVGYARNMYSDLQEIIKYCTKCHLFGTFFKIDSRCTE
jgi:hypothetical protein